MISHNLFTAALCCLLSNYKIKKLNHTPFRQLRINQLGEQFSTIFIRLELLFDHMALFLYYFLVCFKFSFFVVASSFPVFEPTFGGGGIDL